MANSIDPDQMQVLFDYRIFHDRSSKIIGQDVSTDYQL